MKILYTMKDVAKKLNRHYLTIWKWQKSGKIKPIFKTPSGIALFNLKEVSRARKELR